MDKFPQTMTQTIETDTRINRQTEYTLYNRKETEFETKQQQQQNTTHKEKPRPRCFHH